MTRVNYFFTCMGWVLVAIERIDGDVHSAWPMGFWWVAAAFWLVHDVTGIGLSRPRL